MTASEDETVKKTVNTLIKKLQEGNSAARDLAVKELAALGKKAAPYIVTYLKKEEHLEVDLKNLEQTVGAAYWNYRKLFKKEWGHESNQYKNHSSKLYQSRKNAVQGAIKALEMMGIKEEFPTLDYFKDDQ
jgi:hypothetical protein